MEGVKTIRERQEDGDNSDSVDSFSLPWDKFKSEDWVCGPGLVCLYVDDHPLVDRGAHGSKLEHPALSLGNTSNTTSRDPDSIRPPLQASCQLA